MDSQDHETHHTQLTRGLRSRPVTFTPAGSLPPTLAPPPSTAEEGHRVSSLYLSLVSPAPDSPPSPPEQTAQTHTTTREDDQQQQQQQQRQQPDTCPTCHKPITSAAHPQTLAHLLALPRPQLPSAIDRTRKGLAVMQSHGWDPDSRTGLGAQGQGRLYPFIPEERLDKRGVGSDKILKTRSEKVVERKLNAGEVRRAEAKKKKRGEQLARSLYGRDDVDEYLARLG